MYVLKLKLGKYDEDHKHLIVAISEDISKLEKIEKEWDIIKSKTKTIQKDCDRKVIVEMANDFVKKYEIMDEFEGCDGSYIDMDSYLVISDIIYSMTYITKVKQI